MEQTYTIGQAARAAGVGVETVRFYERKGLIEQPPKPLQGARRYSQATVDRIHALQQGQELGLSLAETTTLLALRADPSADCGDVRERAQAHLEDIERRRARLGEVADKLHELIAACPGRGATRECAILDALAVPTADTDDATRSGMDTPSPATQVQLVVDSMACGGCAATVRALLCRMTGVQDATVDHAAGRALVRIDRAGIEPQELAERLTEDGFPARLDRTSASAGT